MVECSTHVSVLCSLGLWELREILGYSNKGRRPYSWIMKPKPTMMVIKLSELLFYQWQDWQDMFFSRLGWALVLSPTTDPWDDCILYCYIYHKKESNHWWIGIYTNLMDPMEVLLVTYRTWFLRSGPLILVCIQHVLLQLMVYYRKAHMENPVEFWSETDSRGSGVCCQQSMFVQPKPGRKLEVYLEMIRPKPHSKDYQIGMNGSNPS